MGLGSNLGPREENIRQALLRISRLDFTSVGKVSSFYYNPARYNAGPDFVNAVAEVYTLLDPLALLRRLEGIERAMGRKEKGNNAPRTIDIDILFYDDLKLSLPELIIPHPRIEERDFVLIPLKELLTS